MGTVRGRSGRATPSARVLIVWVFDAGTTTWARGPHELGPGFAFSPLVVGPAQLPTIRSVAQAAEHLDLAVLTALTRLGEAATKGAHAPNAEAQAEVLHVAEAAMRLADDDVKKRIASLLHGAAKGPFRAILEKFLEAHHMRALELIREEGRQEGRAEGEAHARATTLLRLLRVRGFAVDEDAAGRIRTTSDTALLDRWLDRVMTASSVDEVLAE